MHLTRRAVVGAAVAVGVAGCTGGTGGETTSTATTDGTDSETATGSQATTAAGTAGSSATVRVRSHDELGDVLVGPEGMTLYMFDSDSRGAGTSTCTGGCASAWPPLTVDGEPVPGDGVTATLGTLEREDGGTQVTAGGWPLYYFASDESPGDAKGQASSDVWWVLAPDGTPVRGAMATGSSTSTGATETDSGGY